MSLLRIVCRAPLGPDRPAVGIKLNGVLPSIADCAVYAVGDDGSQVELTNIEQVIWYVGGNKPAGADVRFNNVELDAEGIEQ